MKIGMMTWFHYRNYGTALQVVALSRILKKMGHDPYVINYMPCGQVNDLPNRHWILEVIYKIINKVTNIFNPIINDSIFDKKFTAFYQKLLSFTAECKSLSQLELLNEEFDCFFCGSDQIWSPACYNPHYYLDFVKDTKRMIAYAPSIGLSEVKSTSIKLRMKELAGRFEHLSVREKEGAKLLSEIVGRKVKTVLDPTLLISKEEWADLCIPKKIKGSKYLLVYFLGYNRKHWKLVQLLAKEMNLEIKIIPVYQKDYKRKGCIDECIGPEEFLTYFAHATYICTDSFHGLVFAINFNKEFSVFERFSASSTINQNSRIYNILESLDLYDCLIKNKKNLKSIRRRIDYIDIEKKLQNMVKESVSYIEGCLKSVELSNCEYKDEKSNIETKGSLCCGCGNCENVCPVSAIKIKMNRHGFYQAVIDEKRCISCGKCVAVCSFRNQISVPNIQNGQLFSYKDNENSVLLSSSSGGFAYRMAEFLLGNGYAVLGCTYDDRKKIAKHILISSKDELGKLQGSKYMQSYYADAIKAAIKYKDKLAVFGTPCQISSARRALRNRDDIIYIELICHGVPSYNLYKKYQSYLHRKHNIDIEKMNISFRYKAKGWSEKYICINDIRKRICIHQDKDLYLRMFEMGVCDSETCYECNWRDMSEADIRIGDYWGKRFRRDKTGVSMVLSLTKQGDELVKEMAVYGELKKQPLQDYKIQLISNPPQPTFYEELQNDLNNENISLEEIVDKYLYHLEKTRKYIAKIIRIVKKN